MENMHRKSRLLYVNYWQKLPDPLEVTYLVNSGAEAIDGSLKLAKRYTGREEIVSFKILIMEIPMEH
jgi:4-aminobutyrate aminotransferase-like enzyme